MKSIRLFFLFAALPAVVAVASAQPAVEFSTNTIVMGGGARPSIIFIQCHGLGYGDLSCYGQTNFQTPNLDRLAAEGMRFENYSGGTNLTQTLARLMSGKNSGGVMRAAQLLQQFGYHTGLIGEWTLGAQPWTQGFDEFAGFLNDEDGRNYFSDYIWRFAPKSIMDETNQIMRDFAGREMIYPNTGGQKGQYLPEVLVNATLNFIRINQPDPFNNFRPFFLLANLPAPRSAMAGADDFPVPSDAPFSDEPWPPAAKNRAALITRLDGGIGRLFEQLENLRMTSNVAIFFTSDAPPEKFANTNLNFLRPNGNPADKNNSRLPMIVRWPGMVPAGKVSAKNWDARDVLPTLADVLRTQTPEKTEGKSILAVLRGAEKNDSPTTK